jgi:hypothetical protein
LGPRPLVSPAHLAGPNQSVGFLGRANRPSPTLLAHSPFPLPNTSPATEVTVATACESRPSLVVSAVATWGKRCASTPPTSSSTWIQWTAPLQGDPLPCLGFRQSGTCSSSSMLVASLSGANVAAMLVLVAAQRRWKHPQWVLPVLQRCRRR